MSFITITWMLMAAPTATVVALRGSISNWQLIPAAMAGGLAVVGFWLMVTLVFGRIYCSTACPLGALQDAASHLRPLARIRSPWRYRAPHPWYVRGAMLVILCMAVTLGALASSWAILPFLQVSPYDSYANMPVSYTPQTLPTKSLV
ncbi:MAG: 4Fe-4S binding protein [Muribaculaceae bacterium]|nr:4Fe-4S binding protein [Muribaculaceae bacterium]